MCETMTGRINGVAVSCLPKLIEVGAHEYIDRYKFAAKLSRAISRAPYVI